MRFSPAHKSLETATSPADAVAFLRSHTGGVLLIDGEARARKFVPDPATGSPVSGADPWMLDATDFTLCIPDDSAGCLQLMVNPKVLDAQTHLAADRYLAYHGELNSARLVLWEIDSAKGAGKMFQGADIAIPNPLASCENALLKQLNSSQTLLSAAVQRVLEKVWADPRAVGIDSWGIDINSRFGMTRICFTEPVTESTAPAAIDAFSAS